MCSFFNSSFESQQTHIDTPIRNQKQRVVPPAPNVRAEASAHARVRVRCALTRTACAPGGSLGQATLCLAIELNGRARGAA
jgi:hypothetical protein